MKSQRCIKLTTAVQCAPIKCMTHCTIFCISKAHTHTHTIDVCNIGENICFLVYLYIKIAYLSKCKIAFSRFWFAHTNAHNYTSKFGIKAIYFGRASHSTKYHIIIRHCFLHCGIELRFPLRAVVHTNTHMNVRAPKMLSGPLKFDRT